VATVRGKRNVPLRKGFLWGSATSAHQVEGGCTNNNWFSFESAIDVRGRPRIKDGQEAGPACDHWNRFREDILLMKDLGLNAYRFSVEWSKIQPAEDRIDTAALDHYREVVNELRRNSIEPMVTLHHFTDPLWFAERGSFLDDASPTVFGRFAGVVADALGDSVRLWCTINEPTVYAVNGYVTGEFPPAENNPKRAVRVLRNMLRSHSEAYHVIKNRLPAAQVGLATNIFILEAANRWNPVSRFLVNLADRNIHESVLRYLHSGSFEFNIPGVVRDSFRGVREETSDFVGLNYYTRFRLRFRLLGGPSVVHDVPGDGRSVTDMGWEIYPEGLLRAVRLIRKFTDRPLYVTENGLADDSDTKRATFIRDHLSALEKAVAEGADIRGYFFWSLLDNFEWAHGFSKRFGLYHVDFPTQRRTLREGSRAVAECIRRSSGPA